MKPGAAARRCAREAGKCGAAREMNPASLGCCEKRQPLATPRARIAEGDSAHMRVVTVNDGRHQPRPPRFGCVMFGRGRIQARIGGLSGVVGGLAWVIWVVLAETAAPMLCSGRREHLSALRVVEARRTSSSPSLPPPLRQLVRVGCGRSPASAPRSLQPAASSPPVVSQRKRRDSCTTGRFRRSPRWSCSSRPVPSCSALGRSERSSSRSLLLRLFLSVEG